MESNQPSEASQLVESFARLKEEYEEGAKVQAEWQEKVDDIKFVVTYSSQDNSVYKNIKNGLEEYKKLKNIDSIESLKENVYDIEFEKLLDPDNIMQIINKWIKNLHCIKSDCNHEPTKVYISEGLNQIYCEDHACIPDYQTIPLLFEEELKTHESLLNALEKNLLYTQKQMASIKSENCIIPPNSSRIEKMEKLESTYTILKNTLNNLLILVELIFKNEKSEEIKTTRADTNNYVSLVFIREECKKCDRICSEIDSIIAEIQKDKQVDNIIHTFVNSQKENVEFEEEFKCCSYTKVPSEIYGKKYEVLDTSFQSVILIKKFDDEIK